MLENRVMTVALDSEEVKEWKIEIGANTDRAITENKMNVVFEEGSCAEEVAETVKVGINLSGT